MIVMMVMTLCPHGEHDYDDDDDGIMIVMMVMTFCPDGKHDYEGNDVMP